MMHTSREEGFTIMELLIIIALIAALLVAMLALMDPLNIINRAQDGRRKNDLNELRKTFEDWYNDRECYPTGAEVCPAASIVDNTCTICTTDPTSPSLKPYSSQTLCDPKSSYKYLYVWDTTNPSCPKFYTIYSRLAAKYVAELDTQGCGRGGCGPDSSYGYDYYVTTATSLSNIGMAPFYYCYGTNGRCRNKGTYQNAYNDPTCLDIYPSYPLCCTHIPKPDGCP